MTELTVELPVKLNGAIITRNVHFLLDEIQTDGTLDNIKPEYNNAGLVSIDQYITEISNYLIKIIATEAASFNDNEPEETELLTNLHWLREKLNSLAIPSELIAELRKTK